MSKILSYSLFEPKVLPSHRTHDKWLNNHDRYWYNIPALVAINKILYPDYEMRLYLSKNVWQNPKSKIFETLEKIGNLKIHTIEMDYSGTEPSVWRMIPLWELDTDILHCRDIDSIPTEKEHKYSLYFEESSNTVGTMRTHQNHHGIKCRMLAGLCSYKPNEIPAAIKFPNFQMYYAFKHGNYGCDQDLMIDIFTKNEQFTKDNFLDYHGYFQKNKQPFACHTVSDPQLDKIQTKKNQKDLLQFLKEKELDNWAGEPVDCRGEVTRKVLSFFEKIKFDNDLKTFYKIQD